ncbi:MAG: helix-turn-helix domain-containing protein [Alistipes sp.]|nr:helix-turn-helix domain-containing protein [Alistipes sp.]
MPLIQSVIKAMSIIELLASNPQREYPLSEIADELELDHGTCANIIKTLASHGYVQQSAPRRGYKFGYMFYKLTGTAVVNEDLTKIAREDVASLGRVTNESAILSIIKNDKRIVLFHTTPDRELIVRTNIDKSVYSANTGRVILANYTPDHLEKFIIRNGLPAESEWPAIYEGDNPDLEFRRRLNKIRKEGYEIDFNSNGIVGLAAPLWRGGHVAGSVGVYLPSSRLANEQEILDLVLATAASINRKLELTDRI